MKFYFNYAINSITFFFLLHLTLQKKEKPIVVEKKKLSSYNHIIERAKRSIVLIKSRIEVPFISDSDETRQSTGFIINKEKGIIVTSKTTARISPSFIKVQFHDGSISNGKVIYSDPFLPFGIIQVDVQTNNNMKNFDLLTLGTTKNHVNFFPTSSVLLICLTEDENYVVKRGKIVNTNRNYKNKYGSLFQTNIDRVKGLFGCPVLNSSGQVVGIHYYATLTTSYELKIDYLNNVLPHILNRSNVPRGDIGITLNLLVFGVAKINYKLNLKIADEIANVLLTTGGPPEIMVISSIYPDSSAMGKLKGGDIIYKLNDKIIGNDFLLLDELLNENIGKVVKITVSRNGEIIPLEILVQDAGKEKVTRYVSFSGAYFHEINNSVKSYLYTKLKGVYLTYAKNGSPFNKVSVMNNNKNNYILTSINSKRINNLDELIDYFKNNCENESIYIEGLDFNVFSGTLSADAVDLDFSSSMLEDYVLNTKTRRFESKSVDIKEYCKSKGIQGNSTISNINETNNSYKIENPLTNLRKNNVTISTNVVESKNLNRNELPSAFNNSRRMQSSTNELTKQKRLRTVPKLHSTHNYNKKNFLFNYNKNFFFRQENSKKDVNNTTVMLISSRKSVPNYNNTKQNKTSNDSVESKKIKSFSKKVDRKFIDHLTGLHSFHI